MDIFHSPKLCLRNANGHIFNLNGQINAFNKTIPYARVIEPDINRIDYLHKIKLIKSLPDELTTSIFDIVNNLLSALDQTWFSVATVCRAIGPTGQAYFPFADNITKFDNLISRGLKKFPREIVALVRSFKPYKGGNDLLWALNRICAGNKHKILTPVGVVVGGIHIVHMQISGNAAIPAPLWDRSKQEIVYAITGPKTNIEYNINIAIDISFDQVEVVGGQPVLAVLRQLASIVERILMALEGETRRLGYI